MNCLLGNVLTAKEKKKMQSGAGELLILSLKPYACKGSLGIGREMVSTTYGDIKGITC